MTLQRFQILLEKFKGQRISESEFEELIFAIDEGSFDEYIREDMLISAITAHRSNPILDPEKEKAIWNKMGLFQDETEREEPVIQMDRGRTRIYARRIAAAAIIACLSTASYFLFFNKPPQEIAKVTPQLKNDIAPPTGTKTTLTLANGSTIILDSVQNGTLASQGNAKIVKLNNSQLAYSELTEKATELVYNTLATAKGGQTMVVLADGTKVWLNALSSLKFPSAFIGEGREVELTGEAYFEVEKNPKMPFHVKVADMKVEVLGTHFNVMAYDDENSIKTTLLEGSVKVSKENESRLIVPGEQATLNKAKGNILVVKDVDTEEALAWKNGLFEFNRLDVAGIMRQVGRWYDVEVSYEGSPVNRSFSGIVNRNSNLSQVMKILESANIHFRIEGKKMILKN